MSINETLYYKIVTAIEYVVTFSTLIGGIYVVSPLLELSTSTNGPGTLVATLGSPVGIYLYGAVMIIAALVVLYGLIKKKNWACRAGLLTIAISRLYSVIGAWLIAGFLPLTWFPAFTLFIVVSILWWGRGDRS